MDLIKFNNGIQVSDVWSPNKSLVHIRSTDQMFKFKI
jgi:hypothetical protein